MKIIYISKYASYAPFGIETRHFYLSKEFARLGYESEVYLSTSNHSLSRLPDLLEDNLNGVAIHWIPTLQYANAYGLRRIISWFHFEYRLRNRLKNVKLTSDDVVICSSLSLLTILTGIKLKKKWKCKLVFEVRDIWPLVLTRLINISKKNPMYLMLRYIEMKGYRNSDILIGTMPNLDEHVRCSLGYTKKTLWIPHLINTTISYKTTHRYQNELSEIKKNGGKIIGYTGSINRSSALTYFLDAAKELSNIKDNIHVVLLGAGPSLVEFKEKYKEIRSIHFFTKIPQDEVLAFCQDCDVLYDGYLKSELYKYGNSRNKYVEYCLAKRPILLAYEGFKHFVEEYKCGLVVAPESHLAIVEGIRTVLNKEPNILAKMGENALIFAQQTLSTNWHVDRLIKEINSV